MGVAWDTRTIKTDDSRPLWPSMLQQLAITNRKSIVSQLSLAVKIDDLE